MTWLEVLKHNGWQALILIDQAFGLLVSTAYKEKGWADLCLSANAYRWEVVGVRKWWRVWIDRLFFWQKKHCEDAWNGEIWRRHFPPEMR
jgi:hypothetical protein